MPVVDLYGTAVIKSCSALRQRSCMFAAGQLNDRCLPQGPVKGRPASRPPRFSDLPPAFLYVSNIDAGLRLGQPVLHRLLSTPPGFFSRGAGRSPSLPVVARRTRAGLTASAPWHQSGGAGVMGHNQTAAEPPRWSFSGRGEKRPQTAHAAHINDPRRCHRAVARSHSGRALHRPGARYLRSGAWVWVSGRKPSADYTRLIDQDAGEKSILNWGYFSLMRFMALCQLGPPHILEKA
jgi:hypothetical protein